MSRSYIILTSRSRPEEANCHSIHLVFNPLLLCCSEESFRTCNSAADAVSTAATAHEPSVKPAQQATGITLERQTTVKAVKIHQLDAEQLVLQYSQASHACITMAAKWQDLQGYKVWCIWG